MFAFIEGLVDYVEIDNVVIDAGGFGINVNIPTRLAIVLPAVGEHIKLYTHTAVREDAITLYGFDSKDDLFMFRKLITVSGVGPKGALAILSLLDANSLKLAIISDDAKSISKAQGIGSKTAQKICLELKDKVKISDELIISTISSDSGVKINSTMSTPDIEDAISALSALGYGVTEARKAVLSVPDADNKDSSTLLSEALKFLY